jgi:hypothetical protein
MKHLLKIIIISIFCIPISTIFSQTYFNVQYINGSPKTIDISQLSNITFSGTSITYTLTNSSTTTDDLSNIANFTFGTTNGGSPLPVELVKFVATTDLKTVKLTWSTATEVNNYGFNVERSSTGAWQKIGFVQGHGNSNSPKNYSFTDSSPIAGKVQYRLKQLDTDGKYEYSSAVGINIATPANFLLAPNFPNPFNPSTKISYCLPIDGFVRLKVYDVLGREVSSIVNEIEKAGSYSVTFDGSRLASGVYICRMSSGNYNSSIKMIIMK